MKTHLLSTTTPVKSTGITTATTRPLSTSGRYVDHLLRGKSARDRGKIGAMLVRGEWHVDQYTPAQAARIAGTHARLVHAALGHAPKPLTDAQIDRLIARIGPGRMMAAFDRYTRPQFPFAAE